MKELPYGKWREYEPEDTVRFYALRLHEVGMIKIEPVEAHRPGHRLAIPERAQEGVEVMITPARLPRRGSGARDRRLCSGCAPPPAAAEPPPETTRLRLVRRPSMC